MGGINITRFQMIGDFVPQIVKTGIPKISRIVQNSWFRSLYPKWDPESPTNAATGGITRLVGKFAILETCCHFICNPNSTLALNLFEFWG